jgi:5'-methylthioadenosine phosphorylase
MQDTDAIGIIGGSGLHELPGLEIVDELAIETPYGEPSAPLRVGRLAGRRLVFLARHGDGHRLLPSEVNARANLWALKRAGVTRVLSVSAVGSLREEIEPGHCVVVGQFLDLTRDRPRTFFGDGVVAHVSLADPACAELAGALAEVAGGLGARTHTGVTYACVEGPRFSTRAESHMLRTLGGDVVGMTNLPEATLAREAELCYATLALPTDYDCWRRHDEVRLDAVLAQLARNVELAVRVVAGVAARLDPSGPCRCRTVLDTALITPPARIPPERRKVLAPILARRLGVESPPCSDAPSSRARPPAAC